MKILIVEDSQKDAQLLTAYLKNAYHNVEMDHALSGNEAILLIKENQYDCVFLDYDLPDQSGIEVLKNIYNSETDLPPFPCIMITGQDSQDLFMDAMILGAQDYIQKNQMSADILFLVCEKAKYLFNLKNEKNEISKKYAHTQKIKAIGQLTGGIAHDFNNLLTVVLGNTHLVLEEARKGSIDNNYLIQKMKSIRNSAQKGADLVEHLMSFSRQRGQNPEVLCVNDVIENIDDFLKRTIGKTVDIEYDFSRNLWHCFVDLTELEHMVLNLCANARDAMVDGGVIHIKTSNFDASETNNIVGLSPGEYVLISVSDTGSGIESEHIDKIFDPFFTTKEVGKGTGLGMSTVYSFVESYGGVINVESAPGEGTVIDIYLPKCSEVILKTEEEKPDATPQVCHGTILVTEDEKDIRDIAILILEAHGFKTIEAANGEEALDIIQADHIHIDMLFTDIVMPGEINGVQLAARALVFRPDLKILFTTGYIKDHIPDINLLDEYLVLNKPYLPDEMIEYIQKTLHADPTES